LTTRTQRSKDFFENARMRYINWHFLNLLSYLLTYLLTCFTSP